jgi:hypothetical protein
VVRGGFPPPPSLLAQPARSYPLGRIFHLATVGQNVMPGYARQLRPRDRWAIAYYLRALQRAFPPTPPPGGAASGISIDAGAGGPGLDGGTSATDHRIGAVDAAAAATSAAATAVPSAAAEEEVHATP